MPVVVDKGQAVTGKSVIENGKLTTLGITCKDGVLYILYLNQQYTRKQHANCEKS